LGDKKYETAQGLNSPDFILLFMPIEAAFSMALQSDPQLFNFAWERRIVITSPTTLLATLRTVASIWTQEKRTRNAELISTEAGKLYEKFVGFTEDLIAIGKKLDGAKEDYENAMKKLSSGPGNLVRKTEQLKQMGAKAIKGVNSKLVERAMTDSEDE
jgi:DNA recombination protein RmuC